MLFTIEKGNHEFMFITDSRSTRHGFAHDCTLIMDHEWFGKETKATRYYLNRTWERWQFQSVCLDCIGNMIARRASVLLEEYKAKNNYKRMTKTRKAEFETIKAKDQEIALYESVKQDLTNNLY